MNNNTITITLKHLKGLVDKLPRYSPRLKEYDRDVDLDMVQDEYGEHVSLYDLNKLWKELNER